MALYSLFSAIPSLLLLIGYIVALVFAVVRRRQLGPRAATLLITGLAVLLLLNVINQAWPYAISRLYSSFDRSGLEFSTVIGMVGLLTGLIHLVGIALIVLAAFAGRGYWTGTPAGPPLTYPPAMPPAAGPLPPAGAWPPATPPASAPPVPPA